MIHISEDQFNYIVNTTKDAGHWQGMYKAAKFWLIVGIILGALAGANWTYTKDIIPVLDRAYDYMNKYEKDTYNSKRKKGS